MYRFPRRNRRGIRYVRDDAYDLDESYYSFPSTATERPESSPGGSGRFEMAGDPDGGSPTRRRRARTLDGTSTPVTVIPTTTPPTAPTPPATTQAAATPAREPCRGRNTEPATNPDRNPDGAATIRDVEEIAGERAVRAIEELFRRYHGCPPKTPDRTPEPKPDWIEQPQCRGSPVKHPPPSRPKQRKAKHAMYWIRPRDGRRPGAWGGIKDALTGEGPDVFVVNGPKPSQHDGLSDGHWSGWQSAAADRAWEPYRWNMYPERRIHVEMPWAKRSGDEKYNFWSRKFENADERRQSRGARRLVDRDLWSHEMQRMQLRRAW